MEKYFIDPLNRGWSHAYVNASLIGFWSNKTIIAYRSHIEIIRKIYTKFTFIPIRDTYLILGILIMFFHIVKTSIFRRNHIVFLSIDNTFVPILLILCFPFLHRNKISIVLHNNLDTLSRDKFRRVVHKAIIKLYNPDLYVLAKEMKYFYHKRIYSKSNCIFIKHPNYKHLINGIQKSDLFQNSKINIILLGRQAKLLIDNLKKMDLRKFSYLHFTIVSSSDLDWLSDNEQFTHIKSKLPFVEYYGLLSKADFCLFALDNSSKTRASGILMDCVTMKCPIIAPSVGHFGEYKEFKLGYFYSTYNELMKTFNTINFLRIRRKYFEVNFDAALRYSDFEEMNVGFE